MAKPGTVNSIKISVQIKKYGGGEGGLIKYLIKIAQFSKATSGFERF